MAIHNWPAHERPREKFIDQGPQALTDAELLAIFLRTGVTGKSAVDVARESLEHFGGLRPLLEAKQAQFCQPKGLGPAKYIQLQAVLEMAKRHLQDQLYRGDAMSSPQTTADYLITRLRGYPYEVFTVLFLDNKNRMIACEELFRGTINAASVYPREVVKRALELNSVSVILAHNHPSGVTEPSRADRDITQRLQQALALVDIDVLDHIIIGDGDPLSFAQQGWL